MKHLIAAMTFGACCAAAAQTPEYKFSGFGTVGAVVTDTDEAQFRANYRQNRGATKSPDFGVDSRVGLQGNVKFNEIFSAVGQLLALRREGSDKPNVEWLYAQASVTPWADLRLGRMVLPAFMLSDSRAVGYSSYWVRAPREVYDWYPATSFDGGQVLLRHDVGGFNFQFQASLGDSRTKIYANGLPVPIDLDFHRLSNLAATVDSGNWTLRIAQTLARNTNNSLPDAALYPHVRDSFTEAGMQYDNGRLIVLGEFVVRRESSNGPLNSNAYYLSSGYRVSTWTPFVIYDHYVAKGGVGMPPGTTLNTKTVGVRWDAFKNIALKAQFDRADATSGPINGTAKFFAEAKPINALSVVADFIF